MGSFDIDFLLPYFINFKTIKMENNFLLSRRKLGAYFIASAVVSGLGAPLVNAAVKRTRLPQSNLIYGIKKISGSKKLVLASLDLKTQKVTKLLYPIPGVEVDRGERITSFSRLSDTLFAITTAPVISASRVKGPSVITFSYGSQKRANAKAQQKVLPRLNSSHSISGLIKSTDNKFLTLVKKQDLHSSGLQIMSFDADLKNAGEVVIPASRIAASFHTFCHSSNGNIFAVSTEGDGYHAHANHLWRIDEKSRQVRKIAPLVLNGRKYGSGFRSLTMSDSGILYGLGSEPEDDFNHIYQIDTRTGRMKLIRMFNFMNITT
ncbi:MAG TPA: hypothetical protein V6D19_18505 [Stenomitos sp.]